MIKIERLRLSDEVVDSMLDADRDTLSRSCEWRMTGDQLISEPLCNLDEKYALVLSVLSRYEYTFDDLTSTYELWATRAPEAYDYTGFGTLHLAELPEYRPMSFSAPERLVAVPKERAEYQEGRYASGMFSPRKIA